MLQLPVSVRICWTVVLWRRWVLRVQAWTADCPSYSPVLPRIRQQFRVDVRRDSGHTAECRPATDAGATVWSLAGTHQSGTVHVGRRGSPVPALRVAESDADCATKRRLSYRLQRWGECGWSSRLETVWASLTPCGPQGCRNRARSVFLARNR